METARFDVAVIGGGAGGLYAASAANTIGARTCIIEKTRLGGDCTWFGCMPSKALLKSASAASIVRRLPEFGLKLPGGGTVDSGRVLDHVRDVVREISGHHPPEVFEKRGIKVFFGSPRFTGKDTVKIEGSSGPGAVSASRFIIATGSHPVIPPIEGLGNIRYLTNENIFDLKRLPGSLIVLGAGPIGLELAQAASRLGTKVRVVEMMDRILFREDHEAAAFVEKALRADGVEFHTGSKAVEFTEAGGKVTVTTESKDGKKHALSAENVLVAVGRAPTVEGLGLEEAGIEHTKTGITVNAFLQTTNRNVFACGDVTGPYLFSHMAAYQGQVCVRNAMFRRPVWQKVSYRNVSWATFTDPELAHLGLTEEEAREQHGEVNVYRNEYGASDRAVTDLEKDGLVKVITDAKGRILGAHIAGAQASEIIQGLLAAKSLGLPLAKLAGPIFIYPTLSELIKKTAGKPLLSKLESPLTRKVLKLLRKV